MLLVNKILLYLPSRLFGGVACVRNWLFDSGLLQQRQFTVPTICVGNITVGGTGKTPHTEYLVRQFSDRRVAVLSRGYRRKTKGFVLADEHSSAAEIGDEPLQMHQKFPKIIVAVDEKRAHGIEKLMQLPAPPDIILLDDAFQHRHVKPSFSVVLVDFNRPTDCDTFLPLGRLRESQSGLRRADAVVVTKCPADYQPAENEWRRRLQLADNQEIFFTKIDYDEPQALTAGAEFSFSEKSNLLVVTGIAAPQTLYAHLATMAGAMAKLAFADHHDFSQRDIDKISAEFAKLPEPKAIIITEKDRARLQNGALLPEALRQRTFSIGIRVKFLEKEELFVSLLKEIGTKKG